MDISPRPSLSPADCRTTPSGWAALFRPVAATIFLALVLTHFPVFVGPSRALAAGSLPDLPLGTARIGFSGGGSAVLSGTQALFANPAALQPRARHQAEVSLVDIAAFPSFHTGYAARTALESGYALSLFNDDREGETRRGLMAGFAYGPPELFSLGLVFVNQSIGKNLGIDFHAGALLKPLPGLQVNAVWRNILESGIGQPPYDYPAERALQLGTGYEFASAGPKSESPGSFRATLLYDLHMDALPESRFAHIWALQTEFFPERSLGLGVSWRLPPDERDSLARYGANLSLAFPLNRHLLVCRYGVSFRENQGQPSQSISLAFDFFHEEEPDVTGLAVRLNHPLRHLGETTQPLYFHLVVEGFREVREWKLELAMADGKGRPEKTVREFTGRELPPRSIRWDGKDDKGRELPVGFYVYRLTALDERNRKRQTRFQMLEIAPARPEESR